MKILRTTGGGVYLQQYKEPALSRQVVSFINPSAPVSKLSLPPVEELEDLEPEQIIQYAREAAIVDERDGRPLWKKLSAGRRRKMEIVLGDAMDDEPYISSQLGPLLHFSEQAAQGLRAAVRAVGAQQMAFVVYKNLTDLSTRIPKSLDSIPVERLGGKYPVEIRANKADKDSKETLILGVCSLIHLARAIHQGEMQSTCFVTVAGNCVANPQNLEVSLGMTAHQVLERCGLSRDPTRVIIGGSMTGIAVIDTDKTLVSPVTRGVLAFLEDEKERRYRCIRCGRCINACPQGLNPMLINKAIKLRREKILEEMGLDRCIGCGTCSYVCPAKEEIAADIQRYQAQKAAKPQEEEVLSVETGTP